MRLPECRLMYRAEISRRRFSRMMWKILTGPIFPQEGKEGQEFYRYERLVIQAIIRYGEKIMCNMEDEEGKEIPVSVIEYVVNDLKEDDLAFHNPMHRRILTEAMTHVHDSGFIAERYFIAHSDPELSSIATELASDRYQLSKFHSKTQKITTDEERLFELVPLLMINFKNAIVAAELKHISMPCKILSMKPTMRNAPPLCNAIKR